MDLLKRPETPETDNLQTPSQDAHDANLIKKLEFYRLLIKYDKSHKNYSVFTDEPELDD